MAPNSVLNMSALRKQRLLVEFSGLKKACPEGVYMSLTPGDPTLWAGVMFVRTGPYAPAILRFQVSFPSTYPTLPPLVTFSTDMFHPLITPLTTFTYTTDIQDGGTVSATDDERLPPGGFTLRHGFPGWFGRASKSALNTRQTTGHLLQTPAKSPGGSTSGGDTPDSVTSNSHALARNSEIRSQQIFTYEVLEYISSTFSNGDILDAIPLEAAGNPSAWHAWRAYRIKSGKVFPSTPHLKDENMQWHDGLSDDDGSTSVPEGYQRLPGGTQLLTTTRKPSQWNWEGVWEVRVKRGIDGSLADSMLYGNAALADDLIRFLSIDDDHLEAIKENMIGSLEAA